MRSLDWVVLFAWIVFLVSYGLYRGRGSDSVNQFLLLLLSNSENPASFLASRIA